MIQDKEFLQWIHDRLHYVYKEPYNMDFMHKLRAIIETIPEGRDTRW